MGWHSEFREEGPEKMKLTTRQLRQIIREEMSRVDRKLLREELDGQTSDPENLKAEVTSLRKSLAAELGKAGKVNLESDSAADEIFLEVTAGSSGAKITLNMAFPEWRKATKLGVMDAVKKIIMDEPHFASLRFRVPSNDSSQKAYYTWTNAFKYKGPKRADAIRKIDKTKKHNWYYTWTAK